MVLVGPRLKIERAKTHLQDLELLLEKHFTGGAYTLSTELDSLTGDEILKISTNASLPGDCSGYIGDIVHNLRVSLDQLVASLVRSQNEIVTKQHGFPISASSSKFSRESVDRLQNVPIKAVRLFQRLRPYNGGNNLLWMLAELDNMDKHDNLIPVAAARAQLQTKIGLPSTFITPEGEITLLGGPPGSVPYGYQWGWQSFSDTKWISFGVGSHELYRLQPKLAPFIHSYRANFDIVFGQARSSEGNPVISTLKSTTHYIDRIVDIIERKVL